MARDRRPEDDAYAGDVARLIRGLVRSWRNRVAVSGHSMEPTLRDGDWLLVDPQPRRLVAGDIVVADDPREAGRVLVKRVRSDEDSGLVIAGDHPAHAEEALAVPHASVRGRPWFRYWPPRRIGRIRSPD